MENHHLQCENSLFQWPCSIANRQSWQEGRCFIFENPSINPPKNRFKDIYSMVWDIDPWASRNSGCFPMKRAVMFHIFLLTVNMLTRGYTYKTLRNITIFNGKTHYQRQFSIAWLVVSTPLKKYESQMGWLFPKYGKIKFMFQSPPTSFWPSLNTIKHHENTISQPSPADLMRAVRMKSISSSASPGSLRLTMPDLGEMNHGRCPRQASFQCIFIYLCCNHANTYVYIFFSWSSWLVAINWEYM